MFYFTSTKQILHVFTCIVRNSPVSLPCCLKSLLDCLVDIPPPSTSLTMPDRFPASPSLASTLPSSLFLWLHLPCHGKHKSDQPRWEAERPGKCSHHYK